VFYGNLELTMDLISKLKEGIECPMAEKSESQVGLISKTSQGVIKFTMTEKIHGKTSDVNSTEEGVVEFTLTKESKSTTNFVSEIINDVLKDVMSEKFDDTTNDVNSICEEAEKSSDTTNDVNSICEERQQVDVNEKQSMMCFMNVYECDCGVKTTTVKALFNHKINSGCFGTVLCYCGERVEDLREHNENCILLQKFKCSVCKYVEFKNLQSAYNHMCSAHRNADILLKNGQKLSEYDTRDVYQILTQTMRPIYRAQMATTRFDHMQIEQLKEKSRNNNLRRCILSNLVLESNFAASGSKFYTIAIMHGKRVPCYRKKGRKMFEFEIQCADGDLIVVINTQEIEAPMLYGRLKPLMKRTSFRAQALFDINVNHNVSGMEELVDQVTALMTTLKCSFTEIQKVICMVTCIATIIMSDYKPTVIALMVANYLMTFGVDFSLLSSVTCMIQESVLILVNYLNRSCRSDEEVSAQVGENDPLIALTTLISVIGGAAIFSKIPKGSDIDDICTAAKKLGDVIKGLTFAWAGIERLVRFIFGELYVLYTGYPPEIQQLSMLLAGMEKWYDDIQLLLKNEVPTEIKRSAAKCDHVEALYKQGLNYMRDIQMLKLHPKTYSAFASHMAVLTKFYNLAFVSGARRSGPRLEPFVLMLSGDSGKGKSGVSWALAIDLLSEDGFKVMKEDGTPDWSSDIYMRMIETEFWDGYCGQTVTIYDDFGQMVDSTANPNLEFMELIRSGNLAPYPLHMADLTEKRNTFFCSKAIFLTSNMMPNAMDIKSIHCKEAFKRRIDLCVKVDNLAQWSKTGSEGKTLLDTKKIERETGEVLNLDVYVFTIIDAMTGRELSGKLTYDQLSQKCRNIYREKHEKSTKLFEFLNRHASEQILDDFYIDDEDVMNEEYHAQMGSSDIRVVLKNKEATLNAIDIVGMYHFVEGMYRKKPQVWSAEARQIFDIVHEKFMEFGSDYDASGYRKELDKISIFYDDSYISRMKKPIQALKDFIQFRVVTPLYEKYYYDLSQAAQEAKKDASNFIGKAVECLNKYPIFKSILAVLPVIGLFWFGMKYFKNNSIETSEYSAELVYSGSEKQKNKQRFRTELVYSGSEKQKNKQRFRTELSKSGAEKEKNKQKYRTELSDSDSKTRKQIRMERYNTLKSELDEAIDMKIDESKENVVITDSTSQMQAQMAVDTNAMSVSSKIISNSYTMECEINGRWCAKIKIVFLKGKIALTARHVKIYMQEATRVRIYNRNISKPHVFDAKSILTEDVCNRAGELKDQMLLCFPSSGMNDHASLMGSLADGVQMSHFKTTRAALVVPFDEGVVMKFGNIYARDVETEIQYDASIPNSKDVQKFFVRDRYEYSGLETTDGDCGSLLVAINSMLPKKILGIHVAGKWNEGISSPINCSDIERAMEKMPWSAQLEILIDSAEDKIKFGLDNWIPEGNFVPIGKIPIPILGANTTKIIPSLVHDKITKHNTIPAKLRPFTYGEVNYNPMEIGLKKAGAANIQLDEKIVDICIEDVKRIVNSKIERGVYDQVYDDYIAIRGVLGDDYLPPIERKTSPGYPWVYSKEGLTGKTKWMGKDDNFIVHPDLKARSEYRIKCAKEKKRVLTVWIDTLKDERRPFEKVLAGKTRVFSAGPMDYTFTFRKYFMGFAAHVMKNRIDNEISVGTNCYSTDWTRTAKKLLSKGRKVIAGDFSNFDGTLVADILYKILDIVNDFYDDGEENATIRRVLWAEIVNSIHLCRDNLYMWTHSQPSGCPITSILNSLFNSVSMRYVWMLIVEDSMKNMKSFNENVSMVSYGDDNCVNISDKVIHVFNQVTIAEGYKQIGMTYTDESKTGEIIPYRELSEVAYLKRKFRWEESEMQFIAPLNLDVVLEMVNWIRGELDAEEATRLNLEASAFELSLHGKEIFDKWIVEYKKASRYFEERPEFLTHFQYRYEDMVKYGMITGMF